MSVPWDNLISAGAGLLGAVIGVLGALMASRRASQTAFEQVRYATQYERKAQVMNTAYDKIGITIDKLVILAAERSAEGVERSSTAFLDSTRDALSYMNRNAVERS